METTKVKTNLDRLNELLHNVSDIPTFRRTVTPSFGNHKWLKHALLDKDGVSEEVKELLRMDPKSLLAKHRVPETEPS